ncbi:MAG: TonB-dependent receptor, partial [Selenomonadaceae bacterium]|nr:TonB-dependent receptor [Selenomonadaceae bacterium]
YIQDTITMGRKWTLVPGTRLDHNSNFGSQWSPKIAANYSPDDQTKFYASWGRVYQAPNARQLYTHMTRWMSIGGIPYRYEKWNGSSNLQPETGHTETIGVEHDFSDKANISLSLFNASITGYLDLNDSGSRYGVDPYVAQLLNLNYVNSSEDEQRGINLMYRQKMDDHWSYNLGYAYTHRDRPLGSEEYLNHWRVPQNSYKATLRYQNGPWKASLHGVMGTGTGGTNYMEDDFALLDFNISCEVSDWATIYAKAINFTNQNRSYYGRGSNAPGRLFQFGLDCYF